MGVLPKTSSNLTMGVSNEQGREIYNFDPEPYIIAQGTEWCPRQICPTVLQCDPLGENTPQIYVKSSLTQTKANDSSLKLF